MSYRKTKVCSKCGENKPLSEYYKAKTNKDGLETYCKACKAAQRREWRRRTDSPERRKRNSERVVKWHKANPLKSRLLHKVSDANTRAKALGINGRIDRGDLEAVLGTQGEACTICGESFTDIEGRRMNLDHIEPLWDGGANAVPNLRFICEKCHDEKQSEEVRLRNRKRGHW